MEVLIFSVAIVIIVGVILFLYIRGSTPRYRKSKNYPQVSSTRINRYGEFEIIDEDE